MPIFETFSKRQKRRERAGQPEVYGYDSLPDTFRVQVTHIWKGAIGPYFDMSGLYATGEPPSNKWWRLIHDTLARERGMFALVDKHWNAWAKCQEFLLTTDTDGALDMIELTFRLIDRVIREASPYERDQSQVSEGADDAIEELNYRFRAHGIGYQFIGGEIIRVDSQYIHAEAVVPALSLLNEEGFRGPSDEFLRAHEHYRKGRYKEAITEALKAFESTMRSICDERKWPHEPKATAKTLIEIMFQKGLVPGYLQSHFSGLRAAMESGLPTVRDKSSAHGQGPKPVSVPAHLAAYALHLAASNIVFLAEAHRRTK